MCGIIGIIGNNAAERSLEGLKALEYRGYDSWGITFAEQSGKTNLFYVEKHVGKIGQAKLSVKSDSKIALGHTRWATHGKVLQKNAHPHLSNDGKIAVVHNGIVENYSELKLELSLKGIKFISDTDSEVIPNLIQLNLQSGVSFEEAVRQALLRIDGYYAIAALSLGAQKIVCARNGSPLVLGIGNKEFFVASDATGFIARTNRAVFLNDNEMAIISDSLKVLDVSSGAQKKYRIKELKWTVEQSKKGNYEHFMIKEIFEQPQTIIAATEQPKETLEKLVSMIKNSKNVYLAGCGSSYHASLLGAYFFALIGKVRVTPILASEFIQHIPFFDSNSLVIGISQSGETADLLECLKVAKSKGAKIASIVNVMDSSVMRLSDISLLMNAGPEICVLSTKSFTSQVAILLLLAHSLINDAAFCRNLLKNTVSVWVAKNLLKLNDSAKTLAKKLANSKDIFVIGREEAYPLALEAALKIKEVSYIHAEGFAGAELKHGTIALVEEGTPAIALVTSSSRPTILSNAIEMKTRGAYIIGIDSEKNEVFDEFLQTNGEHGIAPIEQIIPVQLLAYYLALERGLDPDKPRNLAKSVTVK